MPSPRRTSALSALSTLVACLLSLPVAPSCVPNAAADKPAPASWAVQRVQLGLVQPVADMDDKRSAFSRMRVPPRERRVRVTDTNVALDASGHGFVPFAVDVRFGDEWRANDVVGCVYRDSGAVFVKRPDGYRPAAFLVGKGGAVVEGVCVAAARG